MNILRAITTYLSRRFVVFGVLFFPIPPLYLVYHEGPRVLGNMYYLFGGRSRTFGEAMSDLLVWVALAAYMLWVGMFLAFIVAKLVRRMRERGQEMNSLAME